MADIYRVDSKHKKFLKVGEKLGPNDIVIIAKEDFAEYTQGRILPFQVMNPITTRSLIKLGFLFTVDANTQGNTRDVLYVCDPRENPKDPFEELLMDFERWYAFCANGGVEDFANVEDHTGMVQNPMTGEWGWL